MAIGNLLDRIEAEVGEALEGCVAPDDDLEWGLSLIPTVSCEGCGGELEMAVGFYARLACPESSSHTVVHLVVSLENCDPGEVHQWVRSAWEGMSSNRMMVASGLDLDGTS